MSAFWDGFEKQAASLLGRMPNLASGLRTKLQGGVIKPPKPPTVGQSVGPRSVPPPLPTPRPQKMTPLAQTTAHAQPQIAKPMQQKSRGVPAVSL